MKKELFEADKSGYIKFNTVRGQLPYEVSNPEGAREMKAALSQEAPGEEGISFDTKYEKISSGQFEQLFEMMGKVQKVINGSPIDDSQTLLFVSKLDKAADTLSMMIQEKAQQVTARATMVTEKKSRKFAEQILESGGMPRNESTREKETHGMRETQKMLLNMTMQELEATTALFTAIRDIQDELRNHARSQAIITH